MALGNSAECRELVILFAGYANDSAFCIVSFTYARLYHGGLNLYELPRGEGSSFLYLALGCWYPLLQAYDCEGMR